MVIAGPMEWNQRYFSDVLKIRHRIYASIPAKAPDTSPYIINNEVKICEVVENRPVLDTMIQYYYGPQFDLDSSPVIANYSVIDLDIAAARQNFYNLAATERYKKEVSGFTMTIQNNTVFISTERVIRDQFLQKYISLSDNETANWKFQNTWLTLTKTDLLNIIRAIDSHVQASFNWESAIHDQLNAINDIYQLSSVPIVEN